MAANNNDLLLGQSKARLSYHGIGDVNLLIQQLQGKVDKGEKSTGKYSIQDRIASLKQVASGYYASKGMKDLYAEPVPDKQAEIDAFNKYFSPKAANAPLSEGDKLAMGMNTAGQDTSAQNQRDKINGLAFNGFGETDAQAAAYAPGREAPTNSNGSQSAGGGVDAVQQMLDNDFRNRQLNAQITKDSQDFHLGKVQAQAAFASSVNTPTPANATGAMAKPIANTALSLGFNNNDNGSSDALRKRVRRGLFSTISAGNSSKSALLEKPTLLG